MSHFSIVSGQSYKTNNTGLKPEVSALSRTKESAQLPEKSVARVVNCYSLLDLTRLGAEGGIEDFTDGMYFGNAGLSYETAQANQANYLLDQINCTAGSRILDVGCGNGRMLQTAKSRGAEAVGITISPQQVAHCRSKGLDARLLDYRNLDRHFQGEFDGIVANGSIEHFVQPADAAVGRADAIYSNMFRLFDSVLNPRSCRRVATTIIHFGRANVSPQDALKSPLRHRWGSDAFHFSLLARAFGGYYPSAGQLKECAAGRFDLEIEQDGTEDYYLTSEHWLRVAQRSLYFRPCFQLRLLAKGLRHPVQTGQMVLCHWLAQSWNWQFRGDPAPMQLLRQTWRNVS